MYKKLKLERQHVTLHNINRSHEGYNTSWKLKQNFKKSNKSPTNTFNWKRPTLSRLSFSIPNGTFAFSNFTLFLKIDLECSRKDSITFLHIFVEQTSNFKAFCYFKGIFTSLITILFFNYLVIISFRSSRFEKSKLLSHIQF